MITVMPIFLAEEDGSYVPARTRSGARLVVLSDDLTPDEITAELRLTPDRWWLRGEFASHPDREEPWHRSRPYRSNGWEASSRLPEEAPPEEHLADLLERVGPQAQRVVALVSDPRIGSVRVWFGHHTDNENPGFSLNDALIQGLSALGTGVEVDVYVGPVDSEPTD